MPMDPVIFVSTVAAMFAIFMVFLAYGTITSGD